VHLLSFGTLAGGFLTDRWLGQPDPGFAFSNRSLIKYRLIIDEFGDWDLFQTLLEALNAVGKRHGVPLSAIAVRWVLDQPQVAAAIVGARYARHLPQTLNVFDVALTDADRAEITAVLDRSAGPGGSVFGLEGDRNSRHGRIMKYNLNTNPDDQILAAKGE
jgi:aryl-alcohol dehydrogenase-like predicted oxidoreductase